MQNRTALLQSNGQTREERAEPHPLYVLLSASFLRRHAAEIGGSAGLATLAALVYLLVVQPVYTARAQVLIDPGISNVVREQSIDAMSNVDSERVESEIAVLRSEAVALEVIDRLKLFDSERIGGFLSRWLGLPVRDTDFKDQRIRKAVTEFEANLKVKRIGVSHAVEISFRSQNPEQAARVANTVTDAYIDFQLNSRAEAGRVATQWLEKRLEELRSQMNAAERKLQVYRATRNYSLGRRQERPDALSKSAETSDGNDVPQTWQQPRISSEPVTLEDLETTANSYRRIYETFLQTSMATAQRVSFPIANVRVLTRATPPLTPDRNPKTILLISALIGALAGAALGLFRQRRSARWAQ